MAPHANVKLDVVYDTVCPWCFVGKRRLEQALALRPGLNVRVRWSPFLLNPEMPEGGLDRQAYLAGKFGGAERAERVYAGIARAGHAVGIPFAFDRIRVTPNSVASHRLVRYAARAGDPGALIESLFRAYFLKGVDIGDHRALAALAAAQGLPADDALAYLDSGEDEAWVYAENARLHRMGINGVPAFVAEGGLLLSGAQEPAVLVRVLDLAATRPPPRRPCGAREPSLAPDAHAGCARPRDPIETSRFRRLRPLFKEEMS